ncbi:unnamed protein product, partial [Ixodes persulcatus]
MCPRWNAIKRSECIFSHLALAAVTQKKKQECAATKHGHEHDNRERVVLLHDDQGFAGGLVKPATPARTFRQQSPTLEPSASWLHRGILVSISAFFTQAATRTRPLSFCSVVVEAAACTPSGCSQALSSVPSRHNSVSARPCRRRNQSPHTPPAQVRFSRPACTPTSGREGGERARKKE